MSRRNTRQGKALRRAERERQRRSMTSGQGPQAVEVPAVQVEARPDGSGSRNSGEHGSELLSDAGGASIAEPGEADPDTTADPDDFGGLDADDAGLQAALTVLAVLSDDIGDVAEVVDDLIGDVDGLEVPDGPEDLREPETGQPSAQAGVEDEEIFAVSEDDEDLPAPRVTVAGATKKKKKKRKKR
jgi:hypothetical protein